MTFEAFASITVQLHLFTRIVFISFYNLSLDIWGLSSYFVQGISRFFALFFVHHYYPLCLPKRRLENAAKNARSRQNIAY